MIDPEAAKITRGRVKEWLRANNVGSAQMLVYAFSSVDEARGAGGADIGEELANAWLHCRGSNTRHLPSMWDTLHKCGPSSQPADVKATRPDNVQKTRPAWKGMGVRAASSRAAEVGQEHKLRQAAAQRLVNMIGNWAPATKIDEEDIKDRLCEFELGTLKARAAGLQQWCAWWAKNATASTEVVKSHLRKFFLDTEKVSMPVRRWVLMRWAGQHLLFPVLVGGEDRPKRRIADKELKEQQAVAGDPELLLEFDELLSAMPDDDPLLVPGIVFLVLAHGTLRYQHVQRSVLVGLDNHFLYGACTRGKGRTGFFWVSPRYGLAGKDFGGRLWRLWKSCSERAVEKGGQALGFLCFDVRNCLPLKPIEFQRAVQCLASRVVEEASVCMVTSYTARRYNSTLAEMREARPFESHALSNWHMADASMPLRYAGDKEAATKVAKLLHQRLAEKAATQARPVTWAAMRSCIANEDIPALRTAVVQELAEVGERLTPPPAWLVGRVKLPRQLRFRRRQFGSMPSARILPIKEPKEQEVRRQQTASIIKTEKNAKDEIVPAKDGPTRSGKRAKNAALREDQKGARRGEVAAAEALQGTEIVRFWQATARGGRFFVHFPTNANSPPPCQHNQQRGQPLRNVAAEGNTLQALKDLSQPKNALCDRCIRRLPADDRAAIHRVFGA